MRISIPRTRLVFASLAACLAAASPASAQGGEGEWPAYGRDAGGSRYAPARQITRENVGRLRQAWIYRTGDLGTDPEQEIRFEATPLVVDGTMYLATPRGRVIALDPATGRERWMYDARVDPTLDFGDFATRGVSTWVDPAAAAGARCRRVIYAAIVDARLLALDARDGRLCEGFGRGGSIDLRTGLRNAPFETAEYELTSPPAVVNGMLVVGSAVADNNRTEAASGEVRAFDARTGALRWTWDPVPQDPADPGHATWRGTNGHRTGASNVWSVIVADPERDLVFVPTSSPSPDYFGGERLGDNRYANSVVALRASTGRVVWHFQTVHHDLWDYDNAAPPALATVRVEGREVPAVIQATKSGMLFVLHRETGRPIFPVEERPVPRSDVPGEEASPTQPFPVRTPPLSPHGFTAADAWGPTPADREWCRAEMARLRNDGVFTPPSLRGTLQAPSNIGGSHWGGVAVDPERRIAVVPVNRIAAMVQLIPADSVAAERERSAGERLDYEYTRMRGTPYVMRRRLLRGPSGLPCTPPPFGSLVAVSLRTGEKMWEVPLGSLKALSEAAPPEWGSINLGGPITTASGVVFIAATLDRSLRAFDIETGRELWRGDLPASGRATPMTYVMTSGGRQFVVVAAGGGGPFGTADALVAFALPDEGTTR